MKLESLVIADQDAAVNTSLGLAHTARHVLGVDLAKRFWNKPFKHHLYWGIYSSQAGRGREVLLKDR